VGAGSVVVTGPGELEARNGVKRILHAAAVVGQVRVGFRPIHGLGSCVGHVLEKAASLSDVPIRSVLFPLMGTGTARGALERRAREIIGAAVDHFVNHPDSAVDAVYFLAWKQDELRTCLQVLDQDVRLARPGAGAAKRGARRATRKKAARKKTPRKKALRKKAPRKKTLRKAVRKKTARKKTARKKTARKKTARKKRPRR
jgi:hypothetical protein